MLTSSRTSTIKCLFAALWFLLLTVPGGFAQKTNEWLEGAPIAGAPLTTATLGGTVVDENDDVVSDASVSVKDSIRSLRRHATTSSDGSFTIPQLLAGSYTVAVQRQGFATAEIRNVVLKGDQQLSLKIPLRVGHIDETVVIEADTQGIRKILSPGLTLKRQMIEDVPLNGRSLQPLIGLAPGVVATKATVSEQGQFSVNGQRANANYFTIDGVSANIGVAAGATGLGQSGSGSLPGFNALGSSHALVSVDAIQELRIQTNAYAPEFGRMPGALVSLTTRAGTNQFHATLFEYFRGGALGARDWFANRDRLENPSPRQHDFGGVVGGPVIKDRTFFFFSYEGLRLRLPQITTTEVPSISVRESAPASIKPFLNAFPVPNGNESGNGLAEFSAAYTDSALSHATGIRIDQRINDRMTLFGRYNYAPSNTAQRGFNSSLNTTLLMSFHTETITFGATQIISPRIVNELRANYGRTTAQKSHQLDDFGGAIPFNDAIVFPPGTSRQDSSFTFNFSGASSFSDGRDATSSQRQVNVINALAISAGSHQLKFGIDYRRMFPSYGGWKYRQIATFNGAAAALRERASSVLVLTQTDAALVFTNFSAYAQDTWRVARRLSLVYGLRWEYNPSPTGGNGQDLFTARGLNDPSALTLAPEETPPYQTGYNNFAPRIGLAFQLSQRQGREAILGGSFGVFYDLGAGPLANATSSFPYRRVRSFSNVSYPLSPALAAPLPFRLDLPGGFVRATDPLLKLPYTVQWNVFLEQSLGTNQIVSTSYVAALGRRLLRTEALLNPNPKFSQVFVTTNGATSDYHALQLQYQRRLSRGLQALATYTWSHSIDNSSNDSSPNPPAGKIDPRLDRGPSDFDVRHSFASAITYNFPSRTIGGIGGALLSDWSLDAIVAARTATPVDVFIRRDLGFGQFNFRPDVVAGTALYLNEPSAPGGRLINRAAFAIPSTARQGNLGRNALRGFPVSQMDVALRRRFALGEQVNLQLRIEAFNVFNHPNFGDPLGQLESSLFGHSVSMLGRSLGNMGGGAGFNPTYQIGGPRSLQLALKLQF